MSSSTQSTAIAQSIKDLQPQLLWQLFDRLTQSPRPSKQEEAVLQSIESLCREHQLWFERDPTGNLLIRKPASPGMENRIGVVMQGHVDMVPQKNADCQHNFATDPILTRIDGDWVKAQGTTLGADNGIGVAAGLAVLLSNDLEHGPLEVLLTIDEETGMTGAEGLKPNWIEAEILLNLDTEDEGELYVGCAGGVDVTAKIPMTWQPVASHHRAMRIIVRGLRGGHSGLDIDKGRGNANQMVNRFLLQYAQSLSISVAHFNGGTLRNAIPRESFTTITLPESQVDQLHQALAQFQALLVAEYGQVEPNLQICAEPTDLPKQVYTGESLWRVINSVASALSGVARMSQAFVGVVETSNNLAVVKTEGDQVTVLCLTRSLVNSARDAQAQAIAAGFQLAGATTSLTGAYPGWKPNPESKILQDMIAAYQAMYQKTPAVKVIHAGLECGLLSEHYPDWDMISFGPTIRHAHSPDEMVHIGSVSKFWDYLVYTLANIPVKA